MSSSKPRKKTRPLEYAPVTEKELRESAEWHAETAMYCELCDFAGLDCYGPFVARTHYIQAEAYERWADTLNWSNYLDKVFAVRGHRHKTTKGILSYIKAHENFPNKNPYSPVA